MSLTKRLVITVLLGALLLFCVFGFMATFEPLDRATQIAWRVGYGVVGLLAIFGIVRTNRR